MHPATMKIRISVTFSATTANAIRGGSRYEVNINDKMFTFGFVDLEFDEFQALDLRPVMEPAVAPLRRRLARRRGRLDAVATPHA